MQIGFAIPCKKWIAGRNAIPFGSWIADLECNPFKKDFDYAWLTDRSGPLPLASDVISITDTYRGGDRIKRVMGTGGQQWDSHSPAHRRTPAQDRFHTGELPAARSQQPPVISRRTGGHRCRRDFTNTTAAGGGVYPASVKKNNF